MASLLKSTRNTRSLCNDSYHYVRSDVLGRLCQEDILFLIENNIKSIIDLRELSEILQKPCILEKNNEFMYYHLPVTGGNRCPTSVDDVSKSYMRMVDEQMDRIIKVIETADTNVLFFCNAGKDRTGVVSALLLSRMGIERQIIIDDYMESKENLQELLETYVALNPNVNIDIITPSPRYMNEFLDMIAYEI